MVAGGLGGIAGTWAMNEFQREWTLAVEGPPPESAAGKHDARDWQERDEHQNSNELAAQAAARALLGRALTRAELRTAAPALHFAFGAAMAGLYGGWASRRDGGSVATGLAFGAALWLVADVVAMPVLGLSRPTTRRPLEKHLQALASHLVYGMTTELVRQPCEAIIGPPARTAAGAASGHNRRATR